MYRCSPDGPAARRGIHGMAIPHATNAAPGPSGEQPIGQRPFSLLAALCPRAKALRALAPRPRLAKNEKIPAAMHVLIY